MKKITTLPLLLALLLALPLASCSDDDNNGQQAPSATGTMTDHDGNSYPWVRIGNLDWMAANLRAGDPYWEYPLYSKWGDPLVVTDDMDQSLADYPTYGNYYTWDDAVNNAPDGWRLPTDDDWKDLERALGVSNVDAMGWRDGGGSLAVLASGLHLLYGGKVYHGGQDYGGYCKLHYKDEAAYYWTATEDTVSTDEHSAVFRKLIPNLNRIQRFTSPTSQVWMSVRYVRNAQ